MILVGVGTGGDVAVSDSVEILRRASNGFSTQVHNRLRLEAEAIAAAIAGEAEKRICIVSHGNQEALLDASLRRMPYLRASEVGILENCYVFFHACSTGALLGRAVVTTALIYIGFDAPISAPPSNRSICYSDILAIYQLIITFIQYVEYIDPLSAKVDVKEFLERIKESVLRVEAKHDDASGSVLDAEELVCLRQFRNDICGWIQGLDQMLKPVGAPATPYLW